ncbi:MAG: hypothetical protein ACO307_17285, partial [Ilumatobacteraceae bacterium]
MPISMDWIPGSDAMAIGWPSEPKSVAPNSIVVLRPTGPFAASRLEALDEVRRSRLRDQFGAGAESAYLEALSNGLAEALRAARVRWPDAQMSILGLPIESGSASARAANAALREVLDSLDVIVSSRSILRVPGEPLLDRDVLSALPIAAAIAGERRVFYRTIEGWSSIHGALPIEAARSETSGEMVDPRVVSAGVEPSELAVEAAASEAGWS